MLVPQTKPNQIFTAPSVKYFSLQGRDNKRQFIFLKYPNAEINRGIQDKIRKSLFHKGKRAYERLTFTRLLWKVIPPTNIHPLLQEHFKNPKNLNHMNQVSVSTLHIIFPPGAAGWDWLNKTWIALSFSSIFRLKFCLQLIFVWYFLPLLTESSYSVVGAKKNQTRL